MLKGCNSCNRVGIWKFPIGFHCLKRKFLFDFVDRATSFVGGGVQRGVEQFHNAFPVPFDVDPPQGLPKQ